MSKTQFWSRFCSILAQFWYNFGDNLKRFCEMFYNIFEFMCIILDITSRGFGIYFAISSGLFLLCFLNLFMAYWSMSNRALK